jgi:hypothetical protein
MATLPAASLAALMALVCPQTPPEQCAPIYAGYSGDPRGVYLLMVRANGEITCGTETWPTDLTPFRATWQTAATWQYFEEAAALAHCKGEPIS